ncbi:hypothetical protein [Streptomyces sp. NPDC019539]|uniref:hypothetical protein n=1 Tax=Streptomyces sp. NPDC019539 TaxID=3365063 RepID=UPI00379F86C7
MKLFRRTTLVSILCAAAVTYGGVGTAHAAAPRPALAAVASEQVSDKQIDELAVYLEAIYEGNLRTSGGAFDSAAATTRFGGEFANAVTAKIDDQRAAASASKAARVARKDSYGTCILKGVGLGGLGSATTAIMTKLAEKRWSDAARLITKEAIKRGIKIGVKGGIVGLAASLAASAIWCATPWA